MDEEREALLRWAYDAVAATTWDELIAAHKRHGKDDLLVNGLEMQRARAQRAGRYGFERQTLEGSRAGFLKFIELNEQSGGSPFAGVREPKAPLSPSNRSAAAAVAEPEDEREASSN